MKLLTHDPNTTMELPSFLVFGWWRMPCALTRSSYAVELKLMCIDHALLSREFSEACRQGPSALDPRSGSIVLGGLSISSLYRRFIVAFFGPQIDEISSIYRRYFDDILATCDIFIYRMVVFKGPKGPTT